MPTSPTSQHKKPLSAKDHLRLANNTRVDQTGQIIPGAFHVQNGRTRQRPQVSADNYTPYLAREENVVKPAPLRVPAAPPTTTTTTTMFMPSEEGLATATPVFMNSDGASAAKRTKPEPLPLWEVEQIKEEAEQNAQQKVESNAVPAEEYDQDAAALDKSNISNANSKKKRRRCIILTFLLLVVIIATTVLLILLLPKDNTDAGTSKAIGDIIQPTSEAPTSAPTVDLNVTNYVCQNATRIQEGTIQGSTLGAYNDIAIPVCTPQIGSNGIGVWYVLEGDNQVWTVSLCQNDTTPSAAFDTQISVFQGLSCDTMQCRAANDQFCGDTSQVTFTANINQFYYVYVHGYRQQRGMFQLSAYIEPQDYYQCDKSKEATSDENWNELVGSTYELEQAGDTAEIPKLSCNAQNQLDTVNPKSGLWYTLVGTGNNMTVSSCSDTATYDAEISIIVPNDSADSCASEYSCAIVQHEACPTNIGRIISFQSVINQTYYAIVHGPEDDASARKRSLQNAQAADEFEIGITIVDAVPQGTFIYKPRERCQDAVSLQFDDISFNKTVSVAGTIQPSPPLQFEDNPPFGGTCDDAVYGMSPGLWYKVVGNGRPISATTCHPDTNFDTQITVFTGACSYDDDESNDNDPSTLLTCQVGNDQSFCGDQSFVQWQTEIGVTYRILVHGYGPRVGDFILTLETDSTFAPSMVPSTTPSVAPSIIPTISPSISPSATPTKRPSSTYPTQYPTLNPTITASISPSLTPTDTPSQSPTTLSPSTKPSSTPSVFPSKLPSSAPSAFPSKFPSSTPSNLPSISPSQFPTSSPSVVPTTDTPSQIPSQNPTTASPTASPSFKPSSSPTLVPTSSPTKQPSFNPTSTPTYMPTISPSSAPSPLPSSSPSLRVYEVEEACGNSGPLEVDGSAEVGVIEPVPDFFALGLFQGQCSASTYSNPWGAWYKIEGNNRLIAADSCSQLTSVRLQITVFSGSCGNLQCIAGNDTPCGFVWWEALRGVTYYVFVHPVNPGESGTYLLNLQDQIL